MTDSAVDVARRLRRAGRRDLHATRNWAGWHMEITFGPYEVAWASDPERVRFAKEAARQVWERAHGSPPPSDPETEARALELQRDTWHLSASWRGGYPAEEGRRLLAQFVAAMGVPDGKRDGYQAARVFGPGGASPQVTHWTWKDNEPVAVEPSA